MYLKFIHNQLIPAFCISLLFFVTLMSYEGYAQITPIRWQSAEAPRWNRYQNKNRIDDLIKQKTPQPLKDLLISTSEDIDTTADVPADDPIYNSDGGRGLIDAFDSSGSQWCGIPDSSFCPGNVFTNGNFETVTGDPGAKKDEDIDLATGWQAPWVDSQSPYSSLADLFCTHDSSNTSFPPNLDYHPIPNLGGVYAGMWICNYSGSHTAEWREAMYNKLTTPISKFPIRNYSFSFDLAKLTHSHSGEKVIIGIYGVYNPTNTPCSHPTSNTAPSNLALFGTGNTVLLGTITVPSTFTNQWTPQSFNFSSSQFLTSEITHILITKSDTVLPYKFYMAFDNFCMHVSSDTCNGDEIGDLNMDNKNCCSGYVPISNLTSPASDIATISYNVISGGYMEHIAVIGSCANDAITTPTNVYGSTAGVINFTPPCSVTNFNLYIDVFATLTPTNVEITITHEDGTVCLDTIHFRCEPTPPMACDSIKIEDYVYQDNVLSGRHIEIINHIYPPSDICKVQIQLSPNPNPGASFVWNGSLLLVDGSYRQWGVNNSGNPSYSEINFDASPSLQGVPVPASSTIKFNLGLDWTYNWVGNLNITVTHCDGRTCSQDFHWCAKQHWQDCPLSVIAVSKLTSLPPKLFASEIDVSGSRKVGVKFASVSLVKGSKARIIAQTAERAIPAEDTSDQAKKFVLKSTTNDFAGMFEFSKPLFDSDTVPIRFLIEQSDTNVSTIKINVFYYDKDANPVGGREMEIESGITAIDKSPNSMLSLSHPIIFQPQPNPSSGNINIRYWLPKSESVTIEIYNLLGKYIATVSASIGNKGYNSLNYNASFLQAGSYFIKLKSQSGMSTSSFILTH